MAMLITKFHRLIQSRLLWLGFLIVVVFSFVIWGTQMPDTEGQGPNAAGRLGGEDVPMEEYQRARFNTYLALVLMSGRAINITPEIEEELHDMTWQRMAALREATSLGISSSNDEVVNAIRSFQFLQTEGRFNPQAYDQFAQQFLAQFRATKREFEEHVRQEIILQKLRAITERMNLVTPMEIDRTFTTLTDTFEIEYVKIPPSLVDQNVTVSEEDVLAFYTKDPEQFTRPELVKVKAAVFPAADFVDEVEVSDAEIEEYYDFNLDKYALPSEAPADTNEFSLAETKYRPLEEVREEIMTALKSEQAALRAGDRAAEFVQELSLRHAMGRKAFDEVAAEKGVEVVVTAPFSARQLPAELEEANPALTRAAFNLSDDDDYYYSDPVAGTNFVYVLALLDRQPEKVPEFEEAKPQVEAMAREFAVFNALTEKAQEIHDSAVAGLSAGLSFDEVMAEYKVTPEKPAPFTMNTMELDQEIAAALIRHILVRNPGEVTEVVEMDDSILIGYVKSRTPATETKVEDMRAQIVGTLRRQASPVVFSDLQHYLLQRDGFEDLIRRTPSPSDDAGEEEEEPGA